MKNRNFSSSNFKISSITLRKMPRSAKITEKIARGDSKAVTGWLPLGGIRNEQHLNVQSLSSLGVLQEPAVQTK